MWTPLFFLYNIFSLVISSMISVKLKGLANVQDVSYINNISLIVSVVLVTIAVTTFITLKYGCVSTREGLSFETASIITLVVINLFIEGIYIAAVANAQFKNCPADVRHLFITSLVLNSVAIAGAIGYLIYRATSRQGHSNSILSH